MIETYSVNQRTNACARGLMPAEGVPLLYLAPIAAVVTGYSREHNICPSSVKRVHYAS